MWWKLGAIALFLLGGACVTALLGAAHGGWREAKEAFVGFSLQVGIPLAFTGVCAGLMFLLMP